MTTMKQLGLGLKLSTKKTRKREFPEDMERAVSWAVLVQSVDAHYCPLSRVNDATPIRGLTGPGYSET
jgi:hypothetical protein